MRLVDRMRGPLTWDEALRLLVETPTPRPGELPDLVLEVPWSFRIYKTSRGWFEIARSNGVPMCERADPLAALRLIERDLDNMRVNDH